MLVFEDSFIAWTSQALQAPHYYFTTLSAVAFLVSLCVKIFWTALDVSTDKHTPWFLGLLFFLITCGMLFVPFIVLSVFGINLFLKFPGFA